MTTKHELNSHLELLEKFWRRRPFHDMEIVQLTAVKRRVLIRLTEYTLIVLGASSFQRCSVPTSWLYDRIETAADHFNLDVETGTEHLKVTGRGIRLIRNLDLAVLVPPIDT